MPVAKHTKFIPEQSLWTKTQKNKTKQTKPHKIPIVVKGQEQIKHGWL